MDNPKKTLQWDHAKDEMLIELVKGKPELYDLTSLQYSDNVAKRGWVEISRQMGCEGSKCKERWESLRAQYRKHKNKKTKSGQAADGFQKWKFEDQMSLLLAFTKDRTRVTSLEKAENEAEYSDNSEHDDTQERALGDEASGVAPDRPTLPQQERLTRKRKTQENNSASATLMKYLVDKKKEEHAPQIIDTFFSLMSNTVKKFTPADQHYSYIKTKVFLLVSEMEEKYIHYQSEQAYAQYVCPQPAASPAVSQYSTSLSASPQPIQQFHQATRSQENTHGVPSPPQPACTSQWFNQHDPSSFSS
ncbi:uncharacterized protein LOC135107816 [Scylla paramamosain]|uniref:uncharacterized protein LOC135107816 n=1 Tax=Scylla paramamosain TaxID=85552 RepID=UPI003082D11D